MIRKMRVASSLLGFVLCVANAHSAALSPKWEELTAATCEGDSPVAGRVRAAFRHS